MGHQPIAGTHCCHLHIMGPIIPISDVLRLSSANGSQHRLCCTASVGLPHWGPVLQQQHPRLANAARVREIWRAYSLRSTLSLLVFSSNTFILKCCKNV
ncbi:hypothetical protein E2C01_067424 [Portunus trituberculatus]|uniref:Uncharacterized protein n=1 Tax=Portunus trituberculatus TaxID=210409 RepID=A0A5B7HTQ2_PORTR|nr:hypothetical protein [Portunus trituberculatus]